MAAGLMTWLIAGTGCAQPSQMRLARTPSTNPGELVWWNVTFASGVRAPIIGIEIPQRGSETDQWILADRGVRRFQYRGARLVAAGPPLSTVPSPDDLEQARGWLLHFLPVAAPPRTLPPREVADAASVNALLELLHRHWPDVLVEPPARLTPDKIAREIEAFPHGVLLLLKVSDELGW